MDLGSSDGVLVCYQKEHSLVRLAKLEPGSQSDASKKSDLITVILGQDDLAKLEPRSN